MRIFRCLAAAVCILAFIPLAGAQGQPSMLGLHVKRCTQGKSKVRAKCGSFGVYENRSARSGRIISLRLAILAAKHPSHQAIVFVAGGPGQSAVPLVRSRAIG